MSACQDQQSTIMLDVYGDLDAETRAHLQQHLETCEDCRRERRHLLEVIGKTKAAIQPPELSATEAKRMTNAIIWKLNHARPLKWWPPIFAYRPSRVVPALAAASILIVIASIIGYNTFTADHQYHSSASLQAEQLSPQDLEIIQNLDLLRDMEALQKLVQAVDPSSTNPPADNSFNDTQGMKNIIYGEYHA
jgi:anti-sigma factor RsiW